MAIINRFFIRRFKEIFIDVPAGTVDDGSLSTFNLDTSTTGPFGTSDFLGVIKRSVLIGEIYKDVLDTNPKRLRVDPLPIARYQQLTETEYNRLIQTGDIVENPRTGGKSEVIGWIELGKSYPSFYYQNCVNGKQPKSDNYFDFNEIQLSTYKVSGNGTGQQALQQVGNWNINETYGNWGTTKPFDPFLFEDYIRLSIGTGQGVYDLPFLTNQRLNTIPLLIADRGENFDANNTTVLSPSFSNPLSLTPTVEKTVYGRIRRTITDGFRPIELKTNVGQCLPLPTVVTPPPSIGDGDVVLGGNDEDLLSDTYDYEAQDDTSEILSEDPDDVITVVGQDDVIVPCERGQDLPIQIYSRGEYIGTGSRYYMGAPENTPSNYQQFPSGSIDETDVFPVEMIFDDNMIDDGVRDPRNVAGNIGIIPHGTFKSLLNKNDCIIEIHDDLRDKDGDVPEIVGPIVTQYMENIREQTIYKFETKNPLQLIGYGTDGYDYYSDGNSYIELHGESAFGCGKPFSIADIPEVFNEMYPVAIRENGKLLFGHDENENVSFFRETFERPTQLPIEAIKVLDWLGGLPTRLSEKRGTLSDMFNDFVLGVPDLDFALVGDDASETELNDIVGTALGAIAGATLASFFVSDTKDYLQQIGDATDFIIAGASVGYSIAQVIKTEQGVYKQNWYSQSSKPKPRSIARYRSFNSFWKRDGLNKVYYETALNENQKRSIVSSIGNKDIKISPEGEIIEVDTESKTIETNRTPSNPDSLINTPVWEGKSILQLRTAQFKLSYPSRWKSMMRPIYEQLWFDPEQIKPENVATRRYLGESIFELELGDYETHRKQFGMSKNLYDYIDDAISVKIDDSIISNANTNIDILQGIVTNVGSQLRGFFDEKFANIIGFSITQPTTIVSNVINSFNNLSDLKSYLVLVDTLLESYSELVGIVDSAEDGINKLINLGKRIGDYFKEPDSSFVGPIDKSIENDLKKLSEDLLLNIAESVVNYVINAGLTWLTNELNRTDPPRSSFSPRRVFKKGSVYLKSKSGLYFTNKQPCPIIFLGFNDESVMSSFAEYNNQLDCLSTLSKEDKVENIKYMDKRGFLVSGKQSIMSLVQPNLGDGMIYRGNIDTMINPVKQESIPTINKRIRQYGRNPLLDIFYLNLIPESFANNAKKGIPYTHRTTTPMPYRYPNYNDWSGNRQFTKDYSTPSYFPPHWNEPRITEGSPGKFYKDQSMFKNGDFSFFNRQASNILSAKQRWSMSMETISEENIVVLNDKTPILDIYFGLMQMHIHGFSWQEINQYIERAKKAINISTSSLSFMRETNIPTQVGSSINLEELEQIWKIIQARLNYKNRIHISSNGFWYKVEPISTNLGQGKLGEALLGALLNLGINKTTGVKELSIRYRRQLDLINNSNKTVKIKSAQIVSESTNTDIFGNSAEQFFYVGYDLLTNSQTDGVFDFIPQFTPITLQPFEPNPKKQNKIWLQPFPIWVWFVPYGAQPGFKYVANLELTYEVDGEEYTSTEKLVATVANKPGVQNWSDDLLVTSETIHYGKIDDIVMYEPEKYSVGYQNYSREDIMIDELEIQNEMILDIDGNDVTSTITNTPNFFIFNEVADEFKKRIFPNQKIAWSGGDLLEEIIDGQNIVINKESLLLTNSFVKERIYTADVNVTYSLNPRINSKQRVSKTTKFKLRFSTIS